MGQWDPDRKPYNWRKHKRKDDYDKAKFVPIPLSEHSRLIKREVKEPSPTCVCVESKRTTPV